MTETEVSVTLVLTGFPNAVRVALASARHEAGNRLRNLRARNWWSRYLSTVDSQGANEVDRRLYQGSKDTTSDPLRLAQEYKVTLGSTALDSFIYDLVRDGKRHMTL